MARSRSLLLTICTILAILIHGAHSFYLPGVAPQDFFNGAELTVKVNKLTSIKTQLPYSYYTLPFCTPSKIVDSAENLGEVLRGDRIENSPYTFKMGDAKMCNILCRKTLDAKTAKAFKEKIDDEYRVNMILDNLPLVVPIQRPDQESLPVYQLGYHVGLKGQYSGSKEEKYFIHNHLSFIVKYHKDTQSDSARIVGFEVKPFSVKHAYEGKWSDENPRLTTCDPHTRHTVVNSNTPQEVEDKAEIIFTYDVEFQDSDVKWASRWDAYLLMTDDQIHWFSIVNSLMIVLFLSGMVAMIMLRTLYRDISKYNELETQEEAQEETGWKLVHGDVFRPPSNSDLLCVYVGTGVQFFGMILVTMIFAILGFLSPSNRGGLMTAMLLLWVFMGIFAGYASSRLYKMFKGSEWKKIALRTAVMFPGIVSAIFFVLNALIWGQKSSGAVPFGTMFALVFLWFGISVPLVFVGSYIGSKKPAIEDPVKTNKIPRQIPEQAWYMNPAFSILIGGILPFGAVFIELFFILNTLGRTKKKENNTEEQWSMKSQDESLDLPHFDLTAIANATSNFSFNNLLGQGGFGPVYKGAFKGGQDIAVKRLSKESRQGLDEFMNEVKCIAKLQHRNLVKLLGYCIEHEEKILIYEYMPNKSLDIYIFDQIRSKLLDWPKRFHIINGVSRGLLYLHQDSRLRIIHRDLKLSNILLDNDMNPKISDFGMARSFGENETEANTRRVVGTYGYMSPEYAIDGLFSIKSDVFSFGVLVLEIVSGKRNWGFTHPEHELNLLGHVWKLYKEGRSLELIDELKVESCYVPEVLRSIHVGLLCVQHSPEHRPSMSTVVLMLEGNGLLPQPNEPGFFTERRLIEENKKDLSSTNEVTITVLNGR